MKKKGDKGKPCHIPLQIAIELVKLPLIKSWSAERNKFEQLFGEYNDRIPCTPNVS